MRLFVALEIDAAIRKRLAQFVEVMRAFAPAVRWVNPESFHLTLKFIGEQPPERLGDIKRALAAVHGTAAHLSFRGTGFFPNPRSARVFWCGIETDSGLSTLAIGVDSALAALSIPREIHAFSPHLTLARGGDSRHPRGGSGNPRLQSGDKPNQAFSRLQRQLAKLPPPNFGSMTAAEFFLYESKLSSAGAMYTKLAAFPVRQT